VTGHLPTVPFADLRRIHAPLREEILADVAELVDTGAFVGGAAVAAFEADFAGYCEARLCVGVSSGLDALRIALLAAGIEPGDEVLVPAMTFVATLEAVAQAGGTPVVVDVAPDDRNLDVASAEAAVTARTRFVVPVHLYGQMADMRRLRRLADGHGLRIVEDACQAHGASRDGLRAGAAGEAAAFSFYPAKNLGAMGDAGAIVTSDPRLAEAARALRQHGERRRYDHEVQGYTARLDTVQALVLRRKLRLLDGWNDERRHAARFYHEALEGVGDLSLPAVPTGSRPVWHLFVVRTADPDALATFLRERGVETRRHYPSPVHLTPAFRALGHRAGEFPVAEALAREALSMPLFPGISDAELERVAEAVRAYHFTAAT
jgi:dTDP-4-amino-4,6-dideoxygalactose transaminase